MSKKAYSEWMGPTNSTTQFIPHNNKEEDDQTKQEALKVIGKPEQAQAVRTPVGAVSKRTADDNLGL